MIDPLTTYARSLPLPRRRTERLGAHSTRSFVPGLKETAEREMPWIIYTFGRIHDRYWPPWRSSRILGRAAVGMTCMVCGEERIAVGKLPRFGPVNPEGKEMRDRTRFKLAHLHRDKPAPIAWAKPLMNLNAHQGGLDLDALALRLEADLNETPPLPARSGSPQEDEG